MTTPPGTGLIGALHSGGPDPARAAELDLFGRFVGSWDLAWSARDTGGRLLTARGELHFGWVLGGRAIQDTLGFGGRPGTTVRLYDPARDAWRVVWFSPSLGDICVLEGRRDGDDVFQEGTQPDGAKIRWNFTDVRPDSFVWRGYLDREGTGEWLLEQEMRATRN